MTRYQFQKPKDDKTVAPIWRGIGFIILVAMTVGGFLLVGYVLDLNAELHFLPFSLPTKFTVPITKGIEIPGRWLVQAGVTILLDILLFALMVIIYGIANPIKDEYADNYRRR